MARRPRKPFAQPVLNAKPTMGTAPLAPAPAAPKEIAVKDIAVKVQAAPQPVVQEKAEKAPLLKEAPVKTQPVAAKPAIAEQTPAETKARDLPVAAVDVQPKEAAKPVAEVIARPAPAATATTTSTKIILTADIVAPKSGKIEQDIAAAAEKLIVEGREKFAEAKAKADTLAQAIETSAQSFSDGMKDLNARAVALVKSNMDASFDHAKALIGAKTPFDVWKIHTDLTVKEFKSLNDQAKTFSEAAAQIVAEVAKPIKTSLSGVFSQN